jgi:hypothetical protein
MLLGYFGLFTGMLLTWIWLTEGSPSARKNNKQAGVVQVLCSHCGRMSWVSYGDVRVDTRCMRCR